MKSGTFQKASLLVLSVILLISFAKSASMQGGGEQLTAGNSQGVIYFKGADGVDEAWRGIVIDPPDKLSFQHFEPLTESAITLDDAKVTSIQGNSIYTSTNPYFASVTTDSRSNQSTPAGISGSQAGKFIEWDGFAWLSFPEQWAEKGLYSESITTDRIIARQFQILMTDPNDATRYPPKPVEGTTLGSRNTIANGTGVETLSFNDQSNHFGNLLEMTHGESAELINQIHSVKVDNTPIGVAYELAWVSGTNYSIGNIVTDTGIRYIANTAGVQTVSFASNSSKWDAVVHSTAAGGDVSKTGTPLDNQIAVFTNATTIEGTTGLTYDGSSFAVSGNLIASTDGSSEASPRMMAFTDLTSGEAGRIQFGDAFNAFQLGFNRSMDAYSFHTLRLVGDRNSATALPFNSESNIGTHVINTTIGSPALVVSGAASQTADLFQVRNSAATVLSSFSSLGNLRVPDGTELLPAYSFISDPDIGMRRVSADTLGFSAKGFDVLHLTALADADHFLKITARETGIGDDGILVETVGVTADIDFNFEAKGSGIINLNNHATGGSVEIGRNLSGNGVISVGSFSRTVGIGSIDSGSGTDGEVARFRAPDSTQTKSKILIQSPNSSSNIFIGINNEVNTGTLSFSVDDSNTFSRLVGSFIADGFTVGESIISTGFPVNANNNGTFVLATVNALTMDITTSTLTAEVGTGGQKIIEVNTGDAFLTSSNEEIIFNTSVGEAARFTSLNTTLAGNLTVDTDTLIVDSTLDRVSIGQAATGLTDLTIFQGSNSLKGITLSGTGVTASSTTEGVSLIGGHLSAGNNQLWVTNKVDQGNSAKNSFRYIVGPDVPLIVGVNNTGTTNKNLAFGLNVAGAGMGIGFPINAVQADIKAKLHIQELSDISPVLIAQTTTTNPGTTSKFVGNRNPNANITGEGGGEYYRDTGATSGTYESLEATTGTNWFKRSLNPDRINEILTVAQFEELATAGVITETNTTRVLKFKTSITPFTSTRFVVDGMTGGLKIVDEGKGLSYTYVNPATLFTLTGGDLVTERISFLNGIPGTDFLDYQGRTVGILTDQLNLVNTIIIGFDLGSFRRLSTAVKGPTLIFRDSTIVNWTDSLTFDGLSVGSIQGLAVASSTGVGSGKPLMVIKDTAHRPGSQFVLENIAGDLLAGETVVRLDAGLPNDQRFLLKDSQINTTLGLGLFDTSGSTGVFSAVANNSIAATAITSVTDSSDVAQFEHSGTSPPLGSTVTISGFTTNTAYNTTGIVTVSNAASFQVDYVAFGTTETGSYLQNGITITATAHGLTQGTGVTLDTNLSTMYDGGQLIYEIQTNSFDIAGVFVSTQTGTWSTKGLDQTDPRILAFGNPGSIDSKYIGVTVVNGNATQTSISTQNVYVDLNLNNSAVPASNVERWKLVDADNATVEYIGNEPYSGTYGGTFSVLSPGSQKYEMKVQKDTGGGFVDLTDGIEVPYSTDSSTGTVPISIPITANKGDRFKPSTQNIDGQDNITITNLSMGPM